jgi:hypothetical protein
MLDAIVTFGVLEQFRNPAGAFAAIVSVVARHALLNSGAA